MCIKVEMLAAAEGDALLVTLEGDEPRMLLVDAGRDATGKYLASRFNDVKPTKIDLMVVTHIDRDHIEGVLSLLERCDREALQIDEIWFNGYRHLNAASRGIVQQGAQMGNRLEKAILERRIPWNVSFKDAAVGWIHGVFITKEFGSGSRVTVLGPEAFYLQRLRQVWGEECGYANLVEGVSPRDNTCVMAAQGGVAPFDLDSLATSKWTDDFSAPNRSSISLLIEHGGRSLLLAGDTTSPQLIKAYTKLRDERRTDIHRGSLGRLDALKLPHHGCSKNLSRELLKTIEARAYLVSSSGAFFYHPNDETLARIICHHRNEGLEIPEIYFNYRSSVTAPWAEPARGANVLYRPVFGEAPNGVTWRPQ
jgi:beta-lactamase superfamily II metal-dependent hydrolase